MKSLAIIPARGGSKRIPRKNLRLFEGKPIIAYSIETAIRSSLFDEVMVSTEDEEVAAVAVRYGASVPFMRSQKNADDYAGTAEVLLEVLGEYEKRDQLFDLGCCIYPTAPFVTDQLLIQGRELLLDGGYDTVLPVLKYSYPVQRSLRIKSGALQMIWPEHYPSRSQDLDPTYHDAGQFYWFRVRAMNEKKRLWTDNSGALIISEMEAHDIDTLEDWSVAEFKFRTRRER